MTFRSFAVLILASIPVLFLVGCGGGPSARPQAVTKAGPPVRVLHTYEAQGETAGGDFTAVLAIGSRVLAGSKDGVELLEYHPESGFQSISRFPLRANPTSPSEVFHLRRSGDGTLWASTSDGVARFRDAGFDLQEQSGPARDAAPFRDALWIARSHTLEVFEPVSSRTDRLPILLSREQEDAALPQTRMPLSLCPTSAERILVGTQFGLLTVTHKGSTLEWTHMFGPWDRTDGRGITPMPGNSKLPGNRILNLRVAPDSKRVAVCTDHGLAVYDLDNPGGTWKNFVGLHRVNRADPVQGLFHEEVPGNVEIPSSDISDAAFGQGAIFAGTAKGLAVLPEGGAGTGAVHFLTSEDGLPSSRVNGVDLDPTRPILFVATSFGLAALEITRPGT